VYVTPTESIGQDDEIVVFQNAHAIDPALSTSGTLDEWRASVARLAVGNSRMVFALSVAFAGPLADVAGEDSGGFHLRGGSSSGKTTALKVSASVWGNPGSYPRLWRATANGLERLAALHNDGLLILDELSQIDPKEAGEAAYMLANGQGKTRASRTGAARQATRWRILVLSAGEESLNSLMARAGRKSNAGQEIRLADIDADAGKGMGAFEVLHEQLTPAALALAIKDAAIKYPGTAG
jgi:putative DNA primase/helicase